MGNHLSAESASTRPSWRSWSQEIIVERGAALQGSTLSPGWGLQEGLGPGCCEILSPPRRGMVRKGVRHLCRNGPKGAAHKGAWDEKGSGTFAGTARRVLRTKVPDPFSSQA